VSRAVVCDRTGKERLTRKEAMAKASWWSRTRHARMKHYRCRACGDWHIGNDRRRLPRRKAW
jgi:hypothetical protein